MEKYIANYYQKNSYNIPFTGLAMWTFNSVFKQSYIGYIYILYWYNNSIGSLKSFQKMKRVIRVNLNAKNLVYKLLKSIVQLLIIVYVYVIPSNFIRVNICILVFVYLFKVLHFYWGQAKKTTIGYTMMYMVILVVS